MSSKPKSYAATMTVCQTQADVDAAVAQARAENRSVPIKVIDFRPADEPARFRFPALVQTTYLEQGADASVAVFVLSWRTIERGVSSAWRDVPVPKADEPPPDPAKHSLWFGIHKGKPLTEVPEQYLEWVVLNCQLSAGLRRAIAEQLKRAVAGAAE